MDPTGPAQALWGMRFFLLAAAIPALLAAQWHADFIEGRRLFQLGHYAQAETAYLRALESTQDRPQRALLSNELGVVLVAAGKPAAALDPLRDAISAWQQSPETAVDLSRAWSNLALALVKLGHHQAAEDAFQSSLAVSQAYPAAAGETAVTRQNLGWLRLQQGRYREAQVLFDAALRTLDSGNLPALARTLSGIATLHYRFDRLDAAERCYRQALETATRALGNLHPALLSTMASLVEVLQEQRKYTAAEKMLARAEEVRQAFPDAREGVAVLVNGGRLAYALRQKPEAETRFRQALALAERLYGENHPALCPVLSNLASVLRDSGRTTEAVALWRRGIAVTENANGSRHPELLAPLHNLATEHMAAGDYQVAGELYSRAIELAEQTIGRNHWQNAQLLANYARLLRKTNRSREARQFEKAAKEIAVRLRQESNTSARVDLRELTAGLR